MSYRIDPHRPLTAEFRRIAQVQIGKIMEDLAAARTLPEVKLHDCRKRLKKFRGLLRLVRAANPHLCRAENVRYRDMARSLAGGREATALIETVDRLAKEFPEEGDGLAGLRKALHMRRARLLHEAAGLDAEIAAALESCGQGREALAALSLPDEPEAAGDLLAGGAHHIMRRTAKALAAAGDHGREDTFHELRKGVKAHWMHLRLLHDFWPKPIRSRRKAVEELGERLGELQDLFVLRRILREEGTKLVSQEEIALAQSLLKRSEKRLRKQCLHEAERLFVDAPPRKVTRRLAKNYRAEARPDAHAR